MCKPTIHCDKHQSCTSEDAAEQLTALINRELHLSITPYYLTRFLRENWPTVAKLAHKIIGHLTHVSDDEPIAYLRDIDGTGSLHACGKEDPGAMPVYGTPRTTSYFDRLVVEAHRAAETAKVKFPQPNYVTLKIAEEAGEVVRGAVHYRENRMPWFAVETEIIQLLAMLIRFVTEGDGVNNIYPPTVLTDTPAKKGKSR
jgi:hypothetical protein